MRKIILILFFVLGVLSVRAEVLLVEDFDYNFGSSVAGNGGWFLQYPGGTDLITISNGLEFEGYAQSGIGNGALIACESSSNIPHIAFPTEITSGSVYVAFMIQATLPTGKGGWLMCFRDNDISNYTFNENGRLLINADNQLGISVCKPQSSTAEYMQQELDAQTVYLAVLKYEVKSGVKNDETSLYVFSEMPSAEPTLPTVGPLKDANVADINPKHLLLRGFDEDAWIIVDGIRAATTWEEAVLGVSSALESAKTMKAVSKRFENGRLVITRGNESFSVLGRQIE